MLYDHRLAPTTDPQMGVYEQGNGAYARAAASIDVVNRVHARPCVGESCDLDAPCRRHGASFEIARRYMQMWKDR